MPNHRLNLVPLGYASIALCAFGITSTYFRGYVFVRFDPTSDQWRRIHRSRGIAGLIGVTTDRPTALGIGIVEELIARTSPRRIVDDPGSASFLDPATHRQHWQDITARGELLLRLFGRGAELEAAAEGRPNR